MVKQQRRADRCFVPAAGNSVTWVRFPVGAAHRRNTPHSSTTTEEERGDAAPEGGPGETKRPRLDGSVPPHVSCLRLQDAASTAETRRTDEAAAPRDGVPGSGGQPGSDSSSTAAAEQQGAAECSEDSRAAELQPARSLQVTIQQRSDSRAFRQTDRSADRQTGPRCHVCDVSCCSLQAFQEHMVGSEHLRKLKEMTHSISLNTHTLQQRGRGPDLRRWCDTCQTHFTGDVIIHRRTKQHKVCKQLSRPFCPVCKRHFRTPRKFVEHMKSAEHKEQVQLLEAQEEELITVDAVGCFQEEEEEEEEEEEQEGQEQQEEEEEEEEVEVAEEEEEGGAEEEVKSDVQEAITEDYDPLTTYGSSFILPVSGFVCRLCNKFFYKETTARHTHCRTHTHYLRLQRAQREPNTPVTHDAPVRPGD